MYFFQNFFDGGRSPKIRKSILFIGSASFVSLKKLFSHEYFCLLKYTLLELFTDCGNFYSNVFICMVFGHPLKTLMDDNKSQNTRTKKLTLNSCSAGQITPILTVYTMIFCEF